jgi:hypothetical protein
MFLSYPYSKSNQRYRSTRRLHSHPGPPVVDNATLDFYVDTLTRIDTAGTFPDEYIF